MILGGGTSGWMCAAAIARIAPPELAITLIESEEVGTIGVGEATIPTLAEFNDFLGLEEHDVLRQCQGTFKLGIAFADWLEPGSRYFHPFTPFGRDTPEFPFHQLWLRLRALDAQDAGGIEAYNPGVEAARLGRFVQAQGGGDAILATLRHAYHLDATLYAAMLRRYAGSKGVGRIEGRMVGVEQEAEHGLIRAITLRDGREVAGDLFVDCSGFAALLIGGAMGSSFVDWSHHLPCDRAIALPTARMGAPDPFTLATADAAGWRWRIPLQHRTGNGYVFASGFIDGDEAHRRLLDSVEEKPLADARPLRFQTGHRRAFWQGNCVAIGLAGGFIEPLESTSIHLAQMGIQRLVNLWPGRGCTLAETECYNRLMQTDYERLRDFIILHYHATRRRDTAFWRHVASTPIPDTLAARLDMFRNCGRIIPAPDDLFTAHNWLAVMLGQGIEPASYDALVERVPAEALIRNMALLRQAVSRSAASLPRHQGYIDRHCAAPRQAPPFAAAGAA